MVCDLKLPRGGAVGSGKGEDANVKEEEILKRFGTRRVVAAKSELEDFCAAHLDFFFFFFFKSIKYLKLRRS